MLPRIPRVTIPISVFSTYAWAARNDLYKVTSNNGTDTYTYDAGGRRETAVSGGNTTSYLYDGDTPVSAGPVSMVSLPGSNEILTLSGVVPIHDALGTTLATVNSAGALATQYTYDPFGNVTPGSTGYGTTFGMGGIELDPTGLYHTDARYYNPTLQRFLSEDPANYAGGDANLFAYSGNGPVGASDPSGLDSCPDGDCGGGQPSNAPSYSAPGGIFVLFAQILQAIFGISPTSTAPPANHSNFQDIKQAGLTQFTAGTQISGGTNVYGQAGTELAATTSNKPPLQKDEPTPEYRKPRSGSFASGFSNCVANSIAGGALPCYVGICGAGIALFARGQKAIGGIAAGTGCGAAAATIFCCVGQGFGSDMECPSECPSNEREKGDGEIY